MLDKLVEASPGDKAVRKEHALVSLEIGQLAKAERLLAAQIDPKAPDWHIHSAYGAALAAQGKYRQAQAEFARALEIAPDHPAILNNQALAYALEGRRTDAERLLRRITDSRSSDARAGKAKQNLALLLGLEGRAEEARKMGESVLPPEQARSNAELLTMAPTAPSLARADDKGGGDRTLMRVGASTIAP